MTLFTSKEFPALPREQLVEIAGQVRIRMSARTG